MKANGRIGRLLPFILFLGAGLCVVSSPTPVVCAAPEAQAGAAGAEDAQLRREADEAFDSRDFRVAAQKYERIYPAFADDFELNQRLGWIYAYGPNLNYPRAITYYRKAHALEPANNSVLLDFARVLSWTKSFRESIPLYYELLDREPSIAEYRWELARVLDWAGEGEKAIEQYKLYLAHAPSNFKARNEYGQLLALQKDFSGALEQFNYVLRFQPRNIDARIGLARTLAWSGNLDQALTELDGVLQQAPKHFDARVVRAFVLLWLGRRDDAKKEFQALSKEAPKNGDVQLGLRTIAQQEAREAPPATVAAGAETQQPGEAQPSLLQLAQESEASGKLDQAISYYREYLSRNPDDVDAQFRLARVLGWDKQYAESESLLRDWISRFPGNPAGHLQLGRVLSWDGKNAEALAEFRQAAALDPNNAAIHMELARVLSWSKQYDEALSEYRRVLATEPDNKEARRGVVQVLIWSGQLDNARTELAAFRQRYPEDSDGTAMLRTLETMEAQREAARAISAGASEEYYSALLKKDPNNVAARLELADIYLRDQNYPGAIEQLRAASDLKKDDAGLRRRLAQVLSWNRQYDESADVYEELVTAQPQDEALRLEYARVLSWKRDYPASIGEYRKILDQNPRNTSARLELARVLSWSRQYDQALTEFDAVLRDDPDNVDAWVGKGRIYSYQREYQQSLFSYENALRLKPDDRDARMGKAQALLWSGRTGQARPLLTRLHQENPQDTGVLVSLASAENAAGRPGKALDLLDQASAIEPQNSDVQIMQDQIRSRLRPELRVRWGYTHDTEQLNYWGHQVDFRFNLIPRVRHSLTVDYMPASGPARAFGYPLGTQFATRLPIDPFVPAPGLLGVGDFPASVLTNAEDRMFQSAVQFQFGSEVQVNEWFRLAGSVGAVVLRHGAGDFPGFPGTDTHVIYSISPTFRLNHQWQVSLGFARQYVPYTPKSIGQTTHYDEQSLGILWTPDSLTRIAVNAFHRQIGPKFEIAPEPGYPGGIFQQKGWGGTVTATRILWKNEQAQFEAGYDGTVYGYTHPFGVADPQFTVNPGFFTPSFGQRHAGLVRLNWQPTDFLTWDLHGTLGAQQILRGSNQSLSSTAGTRLDFRLAPRTVLTVGYDYFNAASALQIVSPQGVNAYHSNSVYIMLFYTF